MTQSTGRPPEDVIALKAAEARRRANAGASGEAPTLDSDDEVPRTVEELAKEGFITVGRGRKKRIFVDGGGLCSPGLKRPTDRPLVRGIAAATGAFSRALVVARLEGERREPHQLLADLASGRCQSSPFSEEDVDAARIYLATKLEEAGADLSQPRNYQEQPVDVILLGAALKEAGDPDWNVMHQYARGVRLGVGVKLPRTPAVFLRKGHWKLDGQKDPEAYRSLEGFKGVTCANYPSAHAFAEEVRKTLEDQAARKQIEVMELAQAKRLCGDGLFIAALGALKKGQTPEGETEVRIIHDGTHKVGVNDRIRVRDAGAFPTAPDLATELRLQAATGYPHFALTADVTEAHRAVAIDPRDWGYQACQAHPEGPVYLNRRGTYGMASAAYWWGRLGAALLRYLHYSSRPLALLWLMLFADDWKITAGGPDYALDILGALFTLLIFKVPIKWKKCGGGRTVCWIGYELSLKEWSLGVSERRARWLEEWIARVLADGRIQMRELREALGRLSFVYGALTWDKPFLGPLYTYLAVWGPGACVEIPLYVRMILEWLRRKIRERRSHPCSIARSPRGSIMRVDAKAEGRDVRIGGWIPARDKHGAIRTHLSPWFSLQLTEATAPWAFDRGAPFKAIASLELLATTVGLAVLGPRALPASDIDGLVTVGGLTDSTVSANVLVRGMSTKFPLVCVLMELAAQMESKRARLELEWIPRELNQEADDLSNDITSAFDPDLRMVASIEDVPFLVLNTLMAEARKFYQEAKIHSVKRGPMEWTSPTPKGARLRDRDPW